MKLEVFGIDVENINKWNGCTREKGGKGELGMVELEIGGRGTEKMGEWGNRGTEKATMNYITELKFEGCYNLWYCGTSLPLKSPSCYTPKSICSLSPRLN